MGKIIALLLTGTLLFSFGCQKDEEQTDCEQIVQELNTALKGYYLVVEVYQNGAFLTAETNFNFDAQAIFLQVGNRSINLCELKSYRVVQNGQQQELYLYY